MPTVICVANQKGGIGKTTTATAVASILNEKGHPTLISSATRPIHTAPRSQGSRRYMMSSSTTSPPT